MTAARQGVVEQVERLAAELPASMLHALAEAVEKHGLAGRWQVVHAVAQPHYRALAADLLDAWQADAGLTPQALALALVTAAAMEQRHRSGQSVELVWTGPDAQAIPLRQTEQAILQVIDSAVRRITLVSYAVYHIPRICQALVRAAERGVDLRIIVETPDKLEGQSAYNTVRALGPAVESRSSLYLWPLEKRQRDANDRPGILHVKCAVADGRWLFLSSANLTEYALTINMELGLLVTGGELPGQVEWHFERLVTAGMLVRV